LKWFLGIRLQRAFEPSHHLARPRPAAGLVGEARIGAQLHLAALGVMESQIVGGLGHQGIERRIAGEAENIIDAIVLRPLHGLDATVMTVAAPHDAGVRPMRSQAFRHVLDDGPHLGALRGARRTQDRHHRRPAKPSQPIWRRCATKTGSSMPSAHSGDRHGNESRLTRLWLQRAENVQQVLRVPGGALAAALD
jgi:hypothetical protein